MGLLLLLLLQLLSNTRSLNWQIPPGEVHMPKLLANTCQTASCSSREQREKSRQGRQRGSASNQWAIKREMRPLKDIEMLRNCRVTVVALHSTSRLAAHTKEKTLQDILFMAVFKVSSIWRTVPSHFHALRQAAGHLDVGLVLNLNH